MHRWATYFLELAVTCRIVDRVLGLLQRQSLKGTNYIFD